MRATMLRVLVMVQPLLLANVVISCHGTEQKLVNPKDPRFREPHESFSKLNCTEGRFCETEECVTTAARILESLDTDTKPCDDFYQFACGGWIKEQIIPPEKSSLLTLYNAEKHLAGARNVLAAEIKSSDLSAVKKAKELYASCTKYASRGEEDDSLVDVIKDKFGTWPLTVETWDEDDFDLEDFLTKSIYLGVQPLFEFKVDLTAYEDNGKVVIFHFLWINQPKFGLPLDFYVDVSEDDLTLKLYSKKIYSDAQRFGIENSETAKKDVQEIVEVEKTLAQIYYNTRNIEGSNFTMEELQDNFGQLLDWTHYLTSLLSSPKVGITDFATSDNISVNHPGYLTNMTEYFSQLPKRTQANFIIWRVLYSLESVLVKSHAKVDNLLQNAVFGTISEPSPEESCINYVSEAFNLVVHRLLYTDKFPPEEISTVYAMLKKIQQEFDEVLDEHDWVDEETAKVIREKNAALATTLIYYEQSMDDKLLESVYENITIDEDNFIDNVLSEREESFVRNLRLLRKPYERTLEELPHEMVAQNNFLANKLEFTSIIFEPPSFISHVPQSLNYGGMGTVFGHEIIHAFDDSGYRHNKEGVHGQWWSNDTVAKFEERQQCLIDQYGKFFYDMVDEYVDGQLTLGENMGDNGGIKLSYRAYRKYVAALGDEEPPLPGVDFTHDQLFFINFAQLWCQVENKASAERSIRDVHSPVRFRVLGTAQNSKDFSRAFGCRKGSPMNPDTKCEVW